MASQPSPSLLTTPNTGPTPSSPGRWVIPTFGPPSILKWEAFNPLTNLDPTHAVIRIITAGIAGVDNIQRAGGYPHPRASTPGFSPGYDIVGEIIHLGDQVPKDKGLQVGTKVAALTIFGAHATHIALPWDVLFPLKDTDDEVKIVALPLNYMTAWNMLHPHGERVKPGSTILIGSASGGLGTGVAQLVKAFNMDVRMLGLTRKEKFGYLESLGVEPIDRKSKDISAKVMELTAGKGVDVTYDAICSDESIAQCLGSIKPETGFVIVVGVMGEIADDGSKMLKSVEEIMKEKFTDPRVSLSSLDIEFAKKEAGRKAFYGLVDKVRQEVLEPMVQGVLRLDQKIEADEMLIDGGKITGKWVFGVDVDVAGKFGASD